MKTFDEVYSFLKDNYIHSRFAWRDSNGYVSDYSKIVTQSVIDDLVKSGWSCISHFESRTGQFIKFDNHLTILNPDSPPIEIQRQAGHLTHIMGV